MSAGARITSGVVGGWVGYQCLRLVAGSPPRRDPPCNGSRYANASKLEVLLGRDIWDTFRGKVVLDFGCGFGDEVIEIARHGAERVIGLDIRQRVLDIARAQADAARVADRCSFTTTADTRVDVVLSLDAFEHYQDPRAVLLLIRQLLKPQGELVVAFGPPWFHPYGGHMFSVFPWAHLVFSERALMRWRSDFKPEGATRFVDIDGGLNGMTVRRFEALVSDTGYVVEQFETVPIRNLRLPRHPLVREFLTSVVRCRLRPV